MQHFVVEIQCSDLCSMLAVTEEHNKKTGLNRCTCQNVSMSR